MYSQLNLAGLRRLAITIGTRTVELLGWVRTLRNPTLTLTLALTLALTLTQP